MISLSLGISLILVAISLLISGWSSYNTSIGFSNSNDASTTTFKYLQLQFGHAGYRTQPWEDSFPSVNTSTAVGGVLFPSFASGQVMAATRGSANSQNISPLSLFVRKESHSEDNVENLRDCNGQVINNETIFELYRVTNGKLTCTTFNTNSSGAPVSVRATEMIAHNVIAIEAKFGMANASGLAESFCDYVSSGGGSFTNCQPSHSNPNWRDVATLKMAILVGLPGIGNQETPPSTITMMDKNVTNLDAQLFHTVSVQSVPLKNRIL